MKRARPQPRIGGAAVLLPGERRRDHPRLASRHAVGVDALAPQEVSQLRVKRGGSRRDLSTGRGRRGRCTLPVFSGGAPHCGADTEAGGAAWAGDLGAEPAGAYHCPGGGPAGPLCGCWPGAVLVCPCRAPSGAYVPRRESGAAGVGGSEAEERLDDAPLGPVLPGSNVAMTSPNLLTGGNCRSATESPLPADLRGLRGLL